MSIEAELVIRPEVAVSDLDKAMKKVEKSVKHTGDAVKKELKDSVHDGLADGGKTGSSKLKGYLKAGLAGFAVAIAGALARGFAIAGERKDMADGIIEGVLGERDAIQMKTFAKFQNTSISKMASFMNRVEKYGGDFSAGRDFVVDTGDFISQAKLKESPLLNQFTDVKGGATSQFNAILASMTELNDEKRNKFLADIGWAGDADVIAGMLSEVKGMTGKEAFKHFEKVSKQDEERARLVEKEAMLEKRFGDLQRKANIKSKSAILGSLKGSTLNAYMEGQRLKAQQEVQSIVQYKENAHADLMAKKAKKKMDDLILQLTQGAIKYILPYFMVKQPTKEQIKKAQHNARRRNYGNGDQYVAPSIFTNTKGTGGDL